MTPASSKTGEQIYNNVSAKTALGCRPYIMIITGESLAKLVIVSNRLPGMSLPVTETTDPKPTKVGLLYGDFSLSDKALFSLSAPNLNPLLMVSVLLCFERVY